MPAVQLAIFVLDASGSMGGTVSGAPPGTTKAWQIEEMLCLPLPEPLEKAEDKKAVLENCGVIARLQQSRRKDFIDLAIIRYDTKAEVVEKPQPITDWELSPPGTRLSPPTNVSSPRYMLGGKPFNLLDGMGGATDIAVGLQEANRMKEAYLNLYQQQGGQYEPFVTIVLMSDMLHNEGPANAPLKVAAEIKRTVEIRGRPQVLLAAAAFGDDADLNLMQQIASGPEYAIKTTNPIELRKFFLASATAQLG